MSEDRRQVPRVHEPHSFNLAWLRAVPGEGVLRHRHDADPGADVKSGRLGRHPERAVTRRRPSGWGSRTPSRSRGQLAQHPLVEAGENAATAGTGELLVVNSGDGRVRLEWAPEVVDAAFEAGWMLDPNGYLAPVAVMVTATNDD